MSVVASLEGVVRAMASPIAHAAVSFAALAVVFALLERAFAARRQRFFRAGFATDAAFFFGQYLVWTVVSAVLLVALRPHVAHASALAHVDRLCDALFALLPSGARAAVLVLLAIVLGDLLVYWVHRACHAVPFLWRFHRVHHTSTHLDWVAAHREHPLDGLVTQLAMNVPAFVLGAPFEWLAPVAVFRGMWAVFIHSNVRAPLGPLGLLLGDPSLHRLHHARDRAPANFANLAPYLDVLFGTHARAPDEGYALGVLGDSPRGYLAHLTVPLFTGGTRDGRTSRV